ncbi:MAG TPA: zf-HC2 domain-containing protein, partial [Longimicrobiales bacterium]
MSEHITEERLNDLADGSLEPAERAGVEAHLAACDVCRAQLDATRRLLGRVHGLPRSIEPPSEVRGAVLKAVHTPAAPPARRALWQLRYPLAAAAVLLVVATSLVTRWLMRQSAPATPVALMPAA